MCVTAHQLASLLHQPQLQHFGLNRDVIGVGLRSRRLLPFAPQISQIGNAALVEREAVALPLANPVANDHRKLGCTASDEMPRLKIRSTIGLHFSYQRLILWVCEDAFLRREDTVRGWQLALSLRGIRI